MNQKIKLFTDSASDLPQYYKEKYDVGVVPLNVIFGEEEFKDQVDLSIEEFWERFMSSKELPSTNQVNPHDFSEAFEPFVKEGYTILYIGLSAKLSGTLQSATIAKKLLETDQIYVFDSKSASLGESLLVIRAGEMLAQGHGLDEILEALEKDRENSFAYFTIDSLEHLVRGGRLTRTQGLVGTMLNIKPILRVTPEGTVEVEEKVRSTKKALQTIVAKAKKRKMDFSQKRVAVVHTYGTDTSDLVELIRTQLQPREVVEALIGPSIGTHVGPNGIALFF